MSLISSEEQGAALGQLELRRPAPAVGARVGAPATPKNLTRAGSSGMAAIFTATKGERPAGCRVDGLGPEPFAGTAGFCR